MKVFRTKFFQTFILITVAYLGIVVLISQNPADDASVIDEKLIEMSSDNRLELLVQITGVNPLEGTANARIAGLLLAAIAVQMLVDAIKAFTAQ